MTPIGQAVRADRRESLHRRVSGRSVGDAMASEKAKTSLGRCWNEVTGPGEKEEGQEHLRLPL